MNWGWLTGHLHYNELTVNEPGNPFHYQNRHVTRKENEKKRTIP